MTTELPADIEAAIDAFDSAAQARGWEACMRSVAAADAAELEHAERRAALTAAILARLAAAEAARDEALRELEAERLCHQVSCDGRKRDVRGLEDAIEAETDERRAAERERDHFRDRLDEMHGYLRLAEGSCAKLRDEIAKLREKVRWLSREADTWRQIAEVEAHVGRHDEAQAERLRTAAEAVLAYVESLRFDDSMEPVQCYRDLRAALDAKQD